MARCPTKEKGDKTKKFAVTKGFRIGDPNKEGRNIIEGGQMIELTEAQARYFLKMGAIQLELDFGDADPKPDDSDTAKAGSGDKTEGSGEQDAGAASGSDAVQEAGDGKAGRRKGSL